MNASRWPRFESVLPWIAVLAAAWLALFPITSVDAYYHLATGLRILEAREIPDRGVGSATFGQAAWHDNEWGFQVLAAAVGRTAVDPSGVVTLSAAGRIGLVALRAGVLAATLTLLAATMVRLGVGPGLTAMGVWLAAFLTFGNLFWDIRPQILSYLALAALVELLERAHAGVRWARPACLCIIALWSNVHGAFVVGFGLLACEAAGAWIESRREPASRREAWRLTVLALTAPVAACLNPLGWRQVVHPFLYMTRPEMYAANNEWTRPDLFHLPLLVATYVLLVVALAAGARPRVRHVLRVLLFSGLFLTAIRHLPLAVIVVVPVVAAALTQAAGLGGGRGPLEPFTHFRNRPWARAVAALALGAAIVGLSGAKFIGLVPRFEESGSRSMPEAQVRFLARHGIAGNGFNGYRFGGFLMFRLYPQERVFMDGRNDLYGSFRTSVYNPILGTQPGWESLWRDAVVRYGVGWVLVDATDPLPAALEANGWLVVPDARLEREAPFKAGGILLLLADTAENRAVLEIP